MGLCAGPTQTIPHFVVSVTDEPPYDLRLDITWDPDLGRHTLHQLTLTEQPGGDYVRMSRINQLALADIIERALTDDVIGPDGWPRIVADHPDEDPSPSTPSSTALRTPSAGSGPPPPSPSPEASHSPPARSEQPTPGKLGSSHPRARQGIRLNRLSPVSDSATALTSPAPKRPRVGDAVILGAMWRGRPSYRHAFTSTGGRPNGRRPPAATPTRPSTAGSRPGLPASSRPSTAGGHPRRPASILVSHPATRVTSL